MTDDEAAAQADVLKLMTEAGTFAIAMGAAFQRPQQLAFERMQRSGWVRLIDIGPVADADGRFCRIFQASEEAMTWFRRRQ
jgi:hypothetical protein